MLEVIFLKELEYPFDSNLILSKKKQIKKQLLLKTGLIEKNIAILGGSTTNDIKLIMELFLLNYGIKPNFYESEYNKYLEDALFPSEELLSFRPDIIFIHTSNRNITGYPTMTDDCETINNMLDGEYEKFKSIWDSLFEKFNCPIIQNNFELPYFRIIGNMAASNIHGNINYISRLNDRFYEYSQNHKNFFINDINYLSSMYGLERWSDPFYWHMYKYALCISAIPMLAFNVSNIIKSIFGKNKKGFVLDLDNTLWGGIVGDDGVENLAIGPEVPSGQVFSEFQEYLKKFKELGVILNIDSKNDEKNAIDGLNHPNGILKPDDFIVIKANWMPKDKNFVDIANELNLGVDSLVFVDDNPAEREIVINQIPGVSAPRISKPEEYIKLIDGSGYFEVTNISEDDSKRNDMYKSNIERTKLQSTFTDYNEYLKSLEMKAVIKPFEPLYFDRIAQLTNKSNQFNLTTRRYTANEIENISNSEYYLGLYGSLSDKFGDNGIVTVVIGNISNKVLDIDLWIMSCRVLKRDMEYAMLDEVVRIASNNDIDKIVGHYYPTAKNKMVADFYKVLGFEKVSEDNEGNSDWELIIDNRYINKNNVIDLER